MSALTIRALRKTYGDTVALDDAGPVLEEVRDRALDLMCPTGHAGLPQLAFPSLTLPDGPLGLGLIGAAGSDAALLAWGKAL